MKSAFLLMVVPALLVALGFAQTPAASSNTGNTDQVNVKGCLGGSDGNYTVAQDNTGKTFKITTSSADLKAYVGQDVNLVGSKPGASENSLAVTGLSMISEHCTAAAAAPAASVGAPAEAASVTPSAAVPSPESASIVSLPSAAAAATPDATGSAPAKTAAAVHRTRPSARPRKSAETPAETPAAAAAPAEPVTSTPVADAAAISPPVGPPPATASNPAAPATQASTSRSAGMVVGIVVVLLLVGAGVPLYNRWRKRKLLEQTEGQNLSFTNETKPMNEAKSDPDKSDTSDTTGGRRAA
jgi:hypothetical protein